MIGIFDSGVGGLTVVKEFKRQLPQLPFIYLGDNARSPYGTRGADVIRNYASEDVDFLIRQGATIIVVACNTASAHAGDYLKEKYPAIKFFEVIAPASQAAAGISGGRIGVIGTQGTISNGAYEKALKTIRPETDIFSQACPLFVSLVELDWAHRIETEMIAEQYLSALKDKEIDTLIMGCTHYPLLKKIIQKKIGAQVRLVDPAEEVIKSLTQYLLRQSEEDSAALYGGKEKYFATDTGSQFKDVAEKWLGQEINLEKAELK